MENVDVLLGFFFLLFHVLPISLFHKDFRYIQSHLDPSAVEFYRLCSYQSACSDTLSYSEVFSEEMLP